MIWDSKLKNYFNDIHAYRQIQCTVYFTVNQINKTIIMYLPDKNRNKYKEKLIYH